MNIVRNVKPLPPALPVTADLRAFLVAWAAASRRYGSPAHTLEESAEELARELGLPVRIYVLPTSIMAMDDAEGRTFVVAVQPGPAQVERQVQADALARRVAAGSVAPGPALGLLNGLDRRPEPYGAVVRWAAGAGSSGAAAAALGGGVPEILAATLVGALSASLVPLLARRRETARLTEMAAGFGAALLTAALPVPLARDLVVLAGLIWFMPGYSLTTAFADLATGHLLSGAAGLVAAATTLLLLALGVGFGGRIGAFLPTHPTVDPVALPPWALPLVVGVAALSFAPLLQVRLRWVPWVAAACAVAVAGGMAGEAVFGASLGEAVGALAVAVLGSVAHRRARLPLAVTQVPGLLMLVPGSIGFRAVQALVAQDVLGGVEAATHTALAAIALVGGSLVGAALLPLPRRRPDPAVADARPVG